MAQNKHKNVCRSHLMLRQMTLLQLRRPSQYNILIFVPPFQTLISLLTSLLTEPSAQVSLLFYAILAMHHLCLQDKCPFQENSDDYQHQIFCCGELVSISSSFSCFVHQPLVQQTKFV